MVLGRRSAGIRNLFPEPGLEYSQSLALSGANAQHPRRRTRRRAFAAPILPSTDFAFASVNGAYLAFRPDSVAGFEKIQKLPVVWMGLSTFIRHLHRA